MLTQDDLKAVGELIRTEVKDELKPFREDMKSDFRYLAQEITKLDKKIEGSEDRLGKKIDAVMDHVDGFAKKQLKFDVEMAAHQVALERLGGFPAAS